jgi:hypothetical protein
MNRFDRDVVDLTEPYVCRRCGRSLGWPAPHTGDLGPEALRATRPGQWIDLVWVGDEFTDHEPVRVRGRILAIGPDGERTIEDELSATTIRVRADAVDEVIEIR